MPLARAFTTRRNRQEDDTNMMPAPYIGRAASQRSPDSKPIKRSEISLPVALISTTNMLSYDAPDIAGTQRIVTRNVSMSSSSQKSRSSSGDESDASSRSRRSQATVTDASSVDESSANSPQPNHLTNYFKTSVDAFDNDKNTRHRADSLLSSRRPSIDSPELPQRAPSHSKHAHVQLSHKRSMQRVASPPVSLANSRRESSDMFSATALAEAPAPHPFSKELEQLTEVQEEFHGTVRSAEAEADKTIMQTKGLLQFCAADYMQEIAGLSRNVFEEDAAIYNMGGWF